MAKRRVGARELKTRLGLYLQRVRLGETFVVTDRSEPVAELRPIAAAGDVAAAMRRLAAEGAIVLPTRRAMTRLVPARVAKGVSGSAAIEADRNERA